MNCYLQVALSFNIRLHIPFDGNLCEARFLVIAMIKNQVQLENQCETEITVVVSDMIPRFEKVGIF